MMQPDPELSLDVAALGDDSGVVGATSIAGRKFIVDERTLKMLRSRTPRFVTAGDLPTRVRSRRQPGADPKLDEAVDSDALATTSRAASASRSRS